MMGDFTPKSALPVTSKPASAAEAGFFFSFFCGTTEVVPFPFVEVPERPCFLRVSGTVKTKIKVKGSGQECPLHTN
jgi:hypothetical protein